MKSPVSTINLELLLEISKHGIVGTIPGSLQRAGNVEVILHSYAEVVVGVENGLLRLVDTVNGKPTFTTDVSHWGKMVGIWSHYFNSAVNYGKSDPFGPIWFEYDNPEISRFDGLSHAEAMENDRLVKELHSAIEAFPEQVDRYQDRQG